MTRKQSNNQWSDSIAAHPAPKNSECKNPLEKFSPQFFGIKNAAGRSPRGSCSCTTMPRFTVHLQPRRNWPAWASNVLITHPNLRIWPRRTTTCLSELKKQQTGRHFSSDVDVIAAAETWLDGQPSDFFFFLSGLQKLEQLAKKCIELRGEYVE